MRCHSDDLSLSLLTYFSAILDIDHLTKFMGFDFKMDNNSGLAKSKYDGSKTSSVVNRVI